MNHRHFTLVEVLIAIGMLALFLNGIIILSTQVLSAHKQHQTSAARLVTEDLLAQRWRQFVRNCDSSTPVALKSERLVSGNNSAHVDTDGIWLDGVLTPLPKDLTATFAKDSGDSGLLVLALVDDNKQQLRIVARQGNSGASR